MLHTLGTAKGRKQQNVSIAHRGSCGGGGGRKVRDYFDEKLKTTTNPREQLLRGDVPAPTRQIALKSIVRHASPLKYKHNDLYELSSEQETEYQKDEVMSRVVGGGQVAIGC